MDACIDIHDVNIQEIDKTLMGILLMDRTTRKNVTIQSRTPSDPLRGPPFQGSADPFSLKTVHWTVFRALESSEREAFGEVLHPIGSLSEGAGWP
ncbi:MAG: hypothetical protein ACSW8J_02715 [bacterium]